MKIKNLLTALLLGNNKNKKPLNRNIPVNEKITSTKHCVCDNCEAECSLDDLDPIQDIHQRIGPGSVVPAGQCVLCGALSYLKTVDVTTTQDSISDALAAWEVIYTNDDYYESLKLASKGGIWSAREFLASNINPVLRGYYDKFGEDVDYDCVFIPPLIDAMYLNKWDLNINYDKVCLKTREEWLSN